MRKTIQLIVAGILPLTANGRLDIRREPPFNVLLPGWAALVTVDVERDIPPIQRVFDHMVAYPGESTPLIVGFHPKWITGNAYCLRRDPIHRGWRYRLAFARYDWSMPCRLGDLRRRHAA